MPAADTNISEASAVNQPVRFQFDDEFDAFGGVRSAKIPLVEHRAAIAAAEQEGFRRGEAAARAEAESRLATALANAAQQFDSLMHGLRELETRLEREAVEVAVAVARKLAPALIAREPLAEIEALAADVFVHERSAPHLVVRVAEPVLELAAAKLGALAEQAGFAGRLALLPARDLGEDECVIEWADGGVVRDRSAIEARIAEAVERYLAHAGKSSPAADPEIKR